MKRLISHFVFVLIFMHATYANAQEGTNLNSKQPFSHFHDLAVLSDTTCYIKIIDDFKIRQMMDSLASAKKLDQCMNGLAVKVMRARLILLREISHKYYPNNTMENIRCILYNFYRLTGIKHKGDCDFWGYTFISSYSITQYEKWLESNKEILCIDSASGILFVPQE